MAFDLKGSDLYRTIKQAPRISAGLLFWSSGHSQNFIQMIEMISAIGPTNTKKPQSAVLVNYFHAIHVCGEWEQIVSSDNLQVISLLL